MGKGSGYGKVILFGEHFVVHGVPGIVSAIDSTTDAEVTKVQSEINVKDERKTAKGYSEEKRLQQLESIDRMLKAMGIDPKIGLDIWVGGTLPGFSGLGASAASSVAIARAIAQELHMKVSEEKINQVAYEGEKAYAGNPSGIDNTAATYGGFMWFKKNLGGGPDNVERLSIKAPVEIVIGSTGKVANTKAMVEGVAERKKKDPKKYDPLFAQAGNLAVAGRKALEAGDLETVGKIMTENHKLLVDMEMSHEILNDLCSVALENGALGAKVTGGGRGGYMIALTPGKELQEKIVAAFKQKGYDLIIKATIGGC